MGHVESIRLRRALDLWRLALVTGHPVAWHRRGGSRVFEASLVAWKSWACGRADYRAHSRAVVAARRALRRSSVHLMHLRDHGIVKLVSVPVIGLTIHVVCIPIDHVANGFRMVPLVLLGDAIAAQRPLPFNGKSLKYPLSANGQCVGVSGRWGKVAGAGREEVRV